MDVRELCEGDHDLVCQRREEMFRDAGRSDDVLQSMTQHFRAWLRPRLHDGTYFGFILSDSKQPIAGIGLMLTDWPPHPSHPTQDKRGYVVQSSGKADALDGEILRWFCRDAMPIRLT